MQITPNPKITMSILTYNRCVYLANLLEYLRNISYKPIEIIVIDNHSTDQTKELIKQEYKNIIHIRTHKNIGASARNLGLARASGEIVITLDDDILGITDIDIENIVNYFERNQKVGALNFKIIQDDTGEICNWVHHLKLEEFSETEFLTYEITEGAVAFRKSVFDHTGYYPDHFFLSHEGPDLAYRILNSGFDVVYSNLVCVRHCHADLGRRSWTNYYFDTRNQFWLAARNFPVCYGLYYLAFGLLSMLFYAIRDGYLSYWVKGVADGLRGMKIALKQRNVLNAHTMKVVKSIDRRRPGWKYILRTRIFRRGVRL